MMETQGAAAPKGPAGLNNILNGPSPASPVNASPAKSQDEHRDSAYFSGTDASSKHTSANSFALNNVLSPAGSGYQSSGQDKTPSPIASNQLPQPLVSPSASNMSVASMVSPTTPGSVDVRRFDRPTSLESANSMPYSDGPGPGPGPGPFGPESRRESVDSRINQRFDDMKLGGNSPYASHNPSTVSFHQSTLGSQRNPRPGLDGLSVHRISNGYQPSNDRNPESQSKAVKTAPAITGPAQSTIARAAEPTKGQAWAFPEEDIQRIGPSQYLDSRRSSIAESLASSHMTTDSRLPAGQRRLEDTQEYNRLSSASTEFPPVHHHSLQHKQIGDLQQDAAGQAGNQPYSRTPELRVSHKLAERKRRTEMKELFDQLRDLMPQERGSKASKWEILTKAISEHHRQSEMIRMLTGHCNSATAEVEMLRREVESLRGETSQLRSELGSGHPAHRVAPPPHAFPPAEHYPNGAAAHPQRGNELPPLRSISSSIPNGPESMTGVQYEAPRPNGFRP